MDMFRTVVTRATFQLEIRRVVFPEIGDGLEDIEGVCVSYERKREEPIYTSDHMLCFNAKDELEVTISEFITARANLRYDKKTKRFREKLARLSVLQRHRGLAGVGNHRDAFRTLGMATLPLHEFAAVVGNPDVKLPLQMCSFEGAYVIVSVSTTFDKKLEVAAINEGNEGVSSPSPGIAASGMSPIMEGSDEEDVSGRGSGGFGKPPRPTSGTWFTKNVSNQEEDDGYMSSAATSRTNSFYGTPAGALHVIDDPSSTVRNAAMAATTASYEKNGMLPSVVVSGSNGNPTWQETEVLRQQVEDLELALLRSADVVELEKTRAREALDRVEELEHQLHVMSQQRGGMGGGGSINPDRLAVLTVERDAAFNARDKVVVERDEAIAARTAALNARDTAVSSRNEALEKLNGVKQQLEQLQAENRKCQEHIQMQEMELNRLRSSASGYHVPNDGLERELSLLHERLRQRDAEVASLQDALDRKNDDFQTMLDELIQAKMELGANANELDGLRLEAKRAAQPRSVLAETNRMMQNTMQSITNALPIPKISLPGSSTRGNSGDLPNQSTSGKLFGGLFGNMGADSFQQPDSSNHSANSFRGQNSSREPPRKPTMSNPFSAGFQKPNSQDSLSSMSTSSATPITPASTGSGGFVPPQKPSSNAYGGAPAPYGGAPAPYGGAPAPYGGAPAPYGGAPAPYGGAPSRPQITPSNPPSFNTGGYQSSSQSSGFQPPERKAPPSFLSTAGSSSSVNSTSSQRKPPPKPVF